MNAIWFSIFGTIGILTGMTIKCMWHAVRSGKDEV